MYRHPLLIVVLTLTAAPFRLAAETNVLQTTAAANAFLRKCIVRQASCELSGTVLSTSTARPSLTQLAVLEDESGRVLINPKPPVCLHPGEIVTVRGFALTEPTLEHAIDITNATIRGHRDIRPVSVPLIRLDEERDDLRLVSTEGLVVDVFADEIDPDNIFFLLKDKSVILTVSQYGSRVPNEMLGSHVRVCGVYNRTASGRRKFTGPFIAADTVEVLQPPRSDAFDVLELENVIYLTPTQVAAMDSRKVSGTVLAVWGNDKLMLRDSYGRIVNAQLAAGVAAPACGSSIVLVGWPETDLFRLNLANARWKHATFPPNPMKRQTKTRRWTSIPTGDSSACMAGSAGSPCPAARTAGSIWIAEDSSCPSIWASRHPCRQTSSSAASFPSPDAFSSTPRPAAATRFRRGQATPSS